MISYICFTIAALVLIETHIHKSDFFTPFKIYLFFHSVTFGVASLYYLDDMTPFSTVTNFVYYGSGIAFLIGCMTVKILASEQKVEIKNENISSYNWTLHLMVAGFLGLVFLGGYLLCMKSFGTLPIFAEHRAGAAIDFYESNFLGSQMTNAAIMAMVLFFLAGYKGPTRLTRITCFGVLAVIFILYSLLMSRYLLTVFLFFSIAFYSIHSKKMYVHKLAVIGAVLVLGILATFFLKFSYVLEKVPLEKLWKNERVLEVGFKIPYQYNSNNFWNLEYAFNPPNYEHRYNPTYGYNMVAGFLDMVPGVGNRVRESFNFDSPFNESVQKVDGLNTIGYQWSLFKSFGYMGTIFVPYILGFIASLVYLKAYYRPTLFNNVVYSYTAFAIAMSFAQPQWEMYMWILSQFIILSTIFFCSRNLKSKKPLTA